MFQKLEKKVKSSLYVYFFESKCFNALKSYILKALLNKNWFYFFFLVIWHAEN